MKTKLRGVIAGLLLFGLGIFVASRFFTPRPAAASPDAMASTTLPPALPLVAALDASNAQPGGLSLIFGETAPESNQTTLYRVQVEQPAYKRTLASITHRVGYPPLGVVSPDGSRIALLVIPPDADERAARTGSGEIWTLDTTGGSLTRAAFRAGWLEEWSPDSVWIVYSRLIPLAAPRDPQIPFRSEFYRVRADGSTGNILLSDDSSYALNGLGWSADGEYLVAREDMSGVWTITAQDAASGQTVRTWNLPNTTLIRSISLSPDGTRVLIEDLAGDQQTLLSIDLDASKIQAQGVSLNSAGFSEALPVAPLQPVWRGDQDVWVYHLPINGTLASAGIAGMVNSAGLPQLPTAPGEYLLPEAWSPDGGWLLWQLYPRSDTELFLQKDSASTLTRIQPDQPGNWLRAFGWVTANGGGQ